MLYAIGKEDQKVHFICPNKQNLDIMMEQAKVDIKDYLILQEFCMKDASRITYVDGKCIYNNREYWTKTAVENPITKENFHQLLITHLKQQLIRLLIIQHKVLMQQMYQLIRSIICE